MVDFFWGVHHFSAQHYGVLRLYQNFSNLKNSNFSKKQDRLFCWVIGGIMVMLAEIIHGSSYLQEEKIIPVITSTRLFEGIIYFKILGF